MSGYRIYFLNGEGHINRAADLFAETDQEALDRARALSEGRPIEIWEGARCVLAWPANSSVPPPDAAEAS